MLGPFIAQVTAEEERFLDRPGRCRRSCGRPERFALVDLARASRFPYARGALTGRKQYVLRSIPRRDLCQPNEVVDVELLAADLRVDAGGA